MNENLLRQIKNQLSAKFYVMNDAWLRDCIEFFITDKAPYEVYCKLFPYLSLSIKIIVTIYNIIMYKIK